MDAENDNFYDQLNLSSASSSNNSSSSNLLINLPMLPILHAHDEDESQQQQLRRQSQQQRQHQQQQQQHSQFLPQPVAGMSTATTSNSSAGAAATHNSGGSAIDNNITNNSAHNDNSIQFNSSFLFNNHGSPPLSSPSTTSSTSSPPSTSQHNQSSMHAQTTQDSITTLNTAPPPTPPQPLAQQQQQQPSTTTITTTAPTLFAIASEHLHQQHSSTPTFNQQNDSLISTAHDTDDDEDGNNAHDNDNNEADDGDHHHLDDEVENGEDSIAAQNNSDNEISIQNRQISEGTGAVIDAETIADTIDVSAVEAPPQRAQSGHIDDEDVVIEDEEGYVEDEVFTVDRVIHQQTERHQQQHSPLTLAPSTSSSAGPATQSTAQIAPLNSLLSTKTPLDSVFNFDRNGQPTMFGHEDGPHTSSAAIGSATNQIVDRLKMLYPNVNENETPLPRCWSPHDKCLSIGLSQNNLRVHYKGIGKQHNDAASVRTAYPIPPACGLYYFEVKIISKGKNGYMGIGLTAQQFRMNRLPGWDKQSYGYHGDDGNSFSSSGNGQRYGPTFTTGDIIGCCVNFVDNTCFYTKNGQHLGIAFTDLPTKLYPTVGLQTPGEEVDANFGQEPFKFDQVEDMMKQMREEMKAKIYDFPMNPDYGDPTTLLNRIVSSYLVHNGYSESAAAFCRSTGQTIDEEMSSICNRQKITKLVMSGKMGQAIEHTIRSYPGLLENNTNLLFTLRCRQFIEMINGSDVGPETNCPSNSNNSKSTNPAANTIHSMQTPPPNQTSVIQSTKTYQNGKSSKCTDNSIDVITNDKDSHQRNMPLSPIQVDSDSTDCKASKIAESTSIDFQNDVEMNENSINTNAPNGTAIELATDANNSCKNGDSTEDIDEEMDVDVSPSTRKNSDAIERILEFGKELSQMGQQLEKDNKLTDEERQMLEDAFSLIAYSNPWSSPLGWQLCPTRREAVCTALNSAILESLKYPRRPPLEVCISHAAELLKVMAQTSIGDCAFVNIEDIFPHN